MGRFIPFICLMTAHVGLATPVIFIPQQNKSRDIAINDGDDSLLKGITYGHTSASHFPEAVRVTLSNNSSLLLEVTECKSLGSDSYFNTTKNHCLYRLIPGPSKIGSFSFHDVTDYDHYGESLLIGVDNSSKEVVYLWGNIGRSDDADGTKKTLNYLVDFRKRN